MSDDYLNKLGFFTPVVFCKGNKTAGKRIAEKMDNYLYLGGKKARVVSTADDGVYNVDTSSNRTKYKALKISTYVLSFGIAPLVALIGKGIARLVYKFNVNPEGDSPPFTYSTALEMLEEEINDAGKLENQKKVDEAAAKKLEDETAAKKIEEEAATKRLEEEAAAKKKVEEEAATKRLEEEAEAKKKVEEEAETKRLEEEAEAKKKVAEESKEKAGIDAADKKLCQEKQREFKKEEIDLVMWFMKAAPGDYAIVKKDAGKYFLHIKDGKDFLVQIGENNQLLVSVPEKAFDSFLADFDRIPHSDPKKFGNFNEVIDYCKGEKSQSVLRLVDELKVHEAEEKAREQMVVFKEKEKKRVKKVREDEDSDFEEYSDIEMIPGSDSSEEYSPSTSPEPEVVILGGGIREDLRKQVRLKYLGDLSNIYTSVQSYILISKKRGYHKLVLNKGEFVSKGTQKKSATEEEINAFNKIITTINDAMGSGIDRFFVGDKEISIFEFMDDIFSSHLPKRLIGKYLEKGKLDEKSPLAILTNFNLAIIKEFSEELYNKLNVSEVKESDKAKKAGKEEKGKKGRFLKMSKLRTEPEKKIGQNIELIIDFAKVPLRCKMISEKITELKKPETVGKVEAGLSLTLPPPPISNPFIEMIETEKTFCGQIKWFVEGRKWPGLEKEGEIDFFEALEKVGAITDKEKILFSSDWEDLQESSQAIIDSYPDFSKGTDAENMEKLIGLLSPSKFQKHLKNVANVVAKYNEMRKRLTEVQNNNKVIKAQKLMEYIHNNNKFKDCFAILINPVQRGPRYQMLFKEMLKNIPDGVCKKQFLEIERYAKEVMEIVNPLMLKD